MPAATFEHVIILALRRASFCQHLANNIEDALRTIDWVLPPRDLAKLHDCLPARLADFQNNPTLMNLMTYLSYLGTDTTANYPITPDHFQMPAHNPIPPHPELPNPPAAWIK